MARWLLGRADQLQVFEDAALRPLLCRAWLTAGCRGARRKRHLACCSPLCCRLKHRGPLAERGAPAPPTIPSGQEGLVTPNAHRFRKLSGAAAGGTVFKAARDLRVAVLSRC